MDLDSSIRLRKAINGEMPSRLEYPKPDWVEGQVVRTSGLVEDTCNHGVGHPNKDWMEWHPDKTELAIHGCDGCCSEKSVTNKSMSVDGKPVEATIQFSDDLIGTLHYYDRCTLNIAVKSMDWALAMWDLDNELRGVVRGKKHTDEFSDDFVKGLEWAREKLYEIMDARGISLEDIE